MLCTVENTATITYYRIDDIITTKDAVFSIVESDIDIKRSEHIIENGSFSGFWTQF